jgi:mannose-1-phosphate guanylyltransferase
MRAMILAAGVGSRLAPITDTLPKPLIPVLGKPVLSRIIDLLQISGFTKFIANTHYLGNKINEAYKDQITIRQEDTLSGVAGGIRVCADFLREGNDTFAIIMGDALTDINLSEMLAQHKASGRLATIAVTQVEDTTHFGVVCFDETKKVTSFQEKPKREQALSNWANTGVYLFEPAILDYIPSAEEAAVYDVAHDLFPKLLQNAVSMGVYETNSYWADLGTHSQYRQTLFDCLDGKFPIDISGQKYSWGYLGEETQLGAGCFIKGKAYIGNNCKIGRAILKGHVVIEDNCLIEDGVVLEDCLILANSVIRSGCKIREMSIEPNADIYPTASPVEEAIKITPISDKRSREEILEREFLAFTEKADSEVFKVVKSSQ